MKVLICGGGQVGHSLAKYLSQGDNDVTVIDQSHETIDRFHEQLDVQTIVGHPCQPDTLKSAGIDEADLLIAVTPSDEMNIVACEIAHTIFNVPTKIARIREQSYLDPQWAPLFVARNIGIDHIIYPELEIAKSIRRNINVSGSFEVHSLNDDRILLVGIKAVAGGLALNTPLRLMATVIHGVDFNVALIIRNDQILFPQDHELILAGDEVYFVCNEEDINPVIEAFGHKNEQFKRIVIVGGGNIGNNLLSLLKGNSSYLQLKMIEKQKPTALKLSEKFPDVVIIQGNALEAEILEEANVGGSEVFISVSDDDKVNILASLLAKKLGAKRTLALINSTSYNSLMSSLGVDGVINPRSATISSILHLLRQGKIKSVHSLKDGVAEVIEAEISESSPILNYMVKKINIPNVMQVIVVIRDGVTLFTTHALMFKPGDQVVMVVAPHAIKKAEKMFTNRAEYIF